MSQLHKTFSFGEDNWPTTHVNLRIADAVATTTPLNSLSVLYLILIPFWYSLLYSVFTVWNSQLHCCLQILHAFCFLLHWSIRWWQRIIRNYHHSPAVIAIVANLANVNATRAVIMLIAKCEIADTISGFTCKSQPPRRLSYEWDRSGWWRWLRDWMSESAFCMRNGVVFKWIMRAYFFCYCILLLLS